MVVVFERSVVSVYQATNHDKGVSMMVEEGHVLFRSSWIRNSNEWPSLVHDPLFLCSLTDTGILANNSESVFFRTSLRYTKTKSRGADF